MPEFKISVEDLQKKSLFVATPMYGGNCAGTYTKSMCDLTKLCTQYNIQLQSYFLFNESLITRARNYCSDAFMRSGCTHLMFIDSDIGFNPQDVLLMMHMTDGVDKQIVTGPYPKKTISWEKVKVAVDKGFANENPFQLENFVGDFVFNPVETTQAFRLDEPIEIKEGGTGFMMIHRKALEIYTNKYPELKYLPDHARTEDFDGSREIMAFFDCIIDPKSRRYLSEDYMFSHYARDAGIKVWLLPWIQLKHIGTYAFGGSLNALAAISASPTASQESNKKFYTKVEKPAIIASTNPAPKPAGPTDTNFNLGGIKAAVSPAALGTVAPKTNLSRKERRALQKKGK